MPLLIISVLLLLLLGITVTVKGSSGVTMSTIQSVYDNWNDLASNWADVSGVLTNKEILAIIVNESSGNPQAFNPGDPSYGLMGVSELIGKAYAGIADVSELYNPYTNIKAGSGFLAELKRKFASTFPLDGKSGWVQMYNEGQTHFLQGSRASGYEIAFLDHLRQLTEYENNLSASGSGA
jgi:membrane-bound lytic murein transglycosylase MltF